MEIVALDLTIQIYPRFHMCDGDIHLDRLGYYDPQSEKMTVFSTATLVEAEHCLVCGVIPFSKPCQLVISM